MASLLIICTPNNLYLIVPRFALNFNVQRTFRATSAMAAQKRSHGYNVFNKGSPSRMRMVRRISLGMTTRPRSSMRLTMPVAFIYFSSCLYFFLQELVSAVALNLCVDHYLALHGLLLGGKSSKQPLNYRLFAGLVQACPRVEKNL